MFATGVNVFADGSNRSALARGVIGEWLLDCPWTQAIWTPSDEHKVALTDVAECQGRAAIMLPITVNPDFAVV